jgi:hypothetical protein
LLSCSETVAGADVSDKLFVLQKSCS